MCKLLHNSSPVGKHNPIHFLNFYGIYRAFTSDGTMVLTTKTRKTTQQTNSRNCCPLFHPSDLGKCPPYPPPPQKQNLTTNIVHCYICTTAVKRIHNQRKMMDKLSHQVNQVMHPRGYQWKGLLNVCNSRMYNEIYNNNLN